MDNTSIAFSTGDDSNLPPVNLPTTGMEPPVAQPPQPVKITITKGKSQNTDFWDSLPDAPDNAPSPQAVQAKSEAKNTDFWDSLPDAEIPPEPPVSVMQDINYAVGAGIPKAIGALPQIPAYAGNQVANIMGYGYDKYRDLTGQPLTPEQKVKIQNLAPFATANTLPDLIEHGMAEGVKTLYPSITGQSLTPEQNNKLDNLSLTNLYQPQTPQGRIAQMATISAIAGPETGIGVAPSIGGGIGGQAASELFPNNPVAPVIGGILVGGIGQGGKVGAPALTKAALKVDPSKLQTFNEAGITPTLADVAQNSLPGMAQDLIAKIPGAGGVIKSAQDISLADAEKILQNHGLGQAKSAQGAGQVVQEGLTNWMERAKNIKDKLYKKFESAFPQNKPIDAFPLAKTIDNIRQRMSISPNLAKSFENSEAGSLIKEMEGDLTANQTSNFGQMPYNVIKAYRTKIGQRLSDFSLLKSEDEAVYSQLYGALTEVMRKGAEAHSPEAAKAFDRANSFNAAFMKKAETVIKPILKRPDVQEMFNKVLLQQKIGGKAQSLMDSLTPSEKQIVRGSLLKQMGENSVNVFDPYLLSNKFSALEREAQDALLSGLTNRQKAQFRKGMEALQLMKKSRGIGKDQSAWDLAKTALGYVGAVAGSYTEPLTTLATIGAARAGAKVLTNQKFIKKMSK